MEHFQHCKTMYVSTVGPLDQWTGPGGYGYSYHPIPAALPTYPGVVAALYALIPRDVRCLTTPPHSYREPHAENCLKFEQ